MMANEIKSIMIMKKQRKCKGVTQMLDYGLLILKNFGKGHNTEILASFYVMPRYRVSLE